MSSISSKTIGGGNRTVLYPLGTDYSLGSAVITLDKNFTTAITGHEKSKNLEATITHEIFDDHYTDLLADYLSAEASASAEKYENGDSNAEVTTINNGTEYNILVAITYSGENKSSSDRFVRVFPCQLQGGGYTMEADKSIRPETKLVAIAAPSAITVGSSCFSATLISAATVTIASGSYGTSFWA